MPKPSDAPLVILISAVPFAGGAERIDADQGRVAGGAEGEGRNGAAARGIGGQAQRAVDGERLAGGAEDRAAIEDRDRAASCRSAERSRCRPELPPALTVTLPVPVLDEMLVAELLANSLPALTVVPPV